MSECVSRGLRVGPSKVVTDDGEILTRASQPLDRSLPGGQEFSINQESSKMITY